MVTDRLADARSRWALGVIGALAEFEPEPDGVRVDALGAMSAFGAIRVGSLSATRALAYELPSAESDAWLQGVAFCLPADAARGPARRGITELGPDDEAAREGDRGALLFDLGIGSPWCEVCVRTDDAPLIELLRAHAGDDVLDPRLDLVQRIARASPPRVFRSRLARIEVWQRIPGHGEPSPAGAHTHFLPRLLRPARPVQATVPVPDGWVACLSLFPPHPLRDARGLARPLDRADHDAFQALLAHYGDPAYVEAKRRMLDRLDAAGPDRGRDPEFVERRTDRGGEGRDDRAPATGRAGRIRRLAAIVAARQHRALAAAPQ